MTRPFLLYGIDPVPKGIKEILANLKCCFPKGTPTTVKQRSNPMRKCAAHSSIPKIGIKDVA